ncbi:hypothetical protein [Bizionia paragorgiae]|uniref:hypothetical protein n=1 Tax=Bizionia paragorgiae TaxID=283786 RepID=UPI003A942067
MFGIFKKKKKIDFLYSDLKPGDRIRRILTEFILPELEPLGFRLHKSELTFKRDIGDYQHIIYFQKTRMNSGNFVCKFMPHLSIESNGLKKYYKKNGVKFSGNPMIHNRSAQYLECWNKELLDYGWYDLVNYDNNKVVESLKNNLLNCGMEFFKHSESEIGIVDYIMSLNSHYPIAPTLYDICKMYNNKNKAKEILNWFRDFQMNTDKTFDDSVLESVTERETELKNWL